MKVKVVCIFLVAAFYLGVNDCLAQRQTNIWYFGENAGMVFHSNSPVPVVGSMMTSYGSTTVVSDSSGRLLFYSNGESVWNANHQIMLNGDNLSGDAMATNNSYAVPVPASETKYYLFTIQRASVTTLAGATISYSIIDMTLDYNRGGITLDSKNTILLEDVTEKIAAVPFNSGDGYWLVTHDFNNNEFIVYAITSTGISAPAYYSLGASHNVDLVGNQSIIQAQGHMKFSPDGTKLAVTLRSVNAPALPFQILDFNTSTGELSNPVSLGDFELQYGVSFSTDSKKLYLQGYTRNNDTFDYLYQFDLTAENVPTSRVGLLINNPYLDRIDFGAGFASFDLQLGPDGRLYTAGSPASGNDQLSRKSLFVISLPNEVGYASDVTLKEFSFEQGKVNIGLPNFIQSHFKNLTPTENPNAPCGAGSLEFYPNPVDRFLYIRRQGECARQLFIEVFDALGRNVGSYQVSEKLSYLDLLQFSPAMYFLKVKSQGKSFVIKIIKS